jgi:DNA polymerase-3 subunit epsilon
MALPIARTTLTATPQTSSKPFPKSLNGENESPPTMPPYTMTMKPTNLTEYKEKAKQWACDRLADSDTVILDLESTGILREDPETEIAQICIMNTKGRPLFSMLLKPSQPMSDKVIGIHKIANEDVINQPIFPQIAKMVAFVLKDKHVVAYNADFDWRLLVHMFKKYEIDKPAVSGISCCMDRYSEWCGEWSTKKNGFKWQKLPNFLGIETHDAFNDCQNTLKTMQKMAGLFDEEELTADDISLDF